MLLHPTCSTTHLPGYEAKYDEILEQDVDEIYCLSVNDSFVMNAWFDSLGISMVQSLQMVTQTLLDKWVCLLKKNLYVLDTEVNVIAW